MKKILNKSLNIFLILVLLVISFTTPVYRVKAQTIGDLKANLAAKQAEYDKQKQQKELTEKEQQEIKNKISANENKIISLKQENESLTDDIAKLNKSMEEKYTEIKKIINSEQIDSGEASYLEYIIGATSFTDFIYRASVAEQLSKYNKQLIDEYNKEIDESKAKQDEIAKKQVEIANIQGELNSEYSSLGQEVANISDDMLSTQEEVKLLQDNITKLQSTYGCSDDEDIEACKEVMNTKDTLSGKMNFVTDISLSGTTTDEQMKSLKGFADFEVKDGQLGPFGKFENFLMAENIRNNAFFSSTIGSVITNLVTFDTSRFNSLYGHLTFDKGIVDISPVKSQGNVMSMYILGKMSLLDNSADMKVRGKLASAFSDKLGPLANINPINLVKHTPGLNIVAVKTFALFCEEVSESEMKAIPHLGKGKSDENATKFQIVLRGDTRKPLKMIKSFKWLALNSEIQSAKDFVDTIPTPVEGEEGLSVEELIKLRQQQAEAAAQGKTYNSEHQKKSIVDTIKGKFKK